MPKRLIQQRRGAGRFVYRAKSHLSNGEFCFPKDKSAGRIIDLVHDPVRSAPVMIINFNNETVNLAAPLGSKVGDEVKLLKVGNLPDGLEICNLETVPGFGPKVARTAGSFAKIVSKEGGITTIILPSKKMIHINNECLAVSGRVGGSGRNEKPILKAGKAFHINKAKTVIWPRTGAKSKNAVDHPFGGGSGSIGIPKTVGRRTVRKVGSIYARRTGRKRSKKVVS